MSMAVAHDCNLSANSIFFFSLKIAKSLWFKGLTLQCLQEPESEATKYDKPETIRPKNGCHCLVQDIGVLQENKGGPSLYYIFTVYLELCRFTSDGLHLG